MVRGLWVFVFVRGGFEKKKGGGGGEERMLCELYVEQILTSIMRLIFLSFLASADYFL